MRGGKCVPLWLDQATYEQLDQVARAQERDPIQQARWLLRQALSTAEHRTAVVAAAVGGEDDPAIPGSKWRPSDD